MSEALDRLRETIGKANQIGKRIREARERVPLGEYPEEKDEKEQSNQKEEQSQSK